MRKERKNEALLWFGKWTSKLGNIVFDYANSVSIVGAFSRAPWVLALYQSSETVIQIVFNLIGGAKADSGSRKKILALWQDGFFTGLRAAGAVRDFWTGEAVPGETETM